MNKKGLTIYGLLGIIAGVAIIVVIAIPIGKSIYEKKVQETYERQVDNVVASSKRFASNIKNYIPSDGMTTTVGKLLDNGFLKETREQKNQTNGVKTKVYEDPKSGNFNFDKYINNTTKYTYTFKQDGNKVELIDCGTWTSKINLTNYCN